MSEETKAKTHQVSWVHHQGRLMIITKEKVPGKITPIISDKTEFSLRGADIAIWTQVVELLARGHDIGKTAEHLQTLFEKLTEAIEDLAHLMRTNPKKDIEINYHEHTMQPEIVEVDEAEGKQLRATPSPAGAVQQLSGAPNAVETITDNQDDTPSNEAPPRARVWDDITG